MLQLKSPYKDGTTHMVMSPMEFMERLAALVPRPRLHLIRFHGVLAPNAKLRSKIVPTPPEPAAEPSNDHAHAHRRTVRMSWARLLKRVFDIDIEHCPNCGAALKIIAAIEDPPVIVKILTHLGPTHPRPAACPGAAIRSVPNNLRAKTGCQRNPSPPIALSSRGRRDGEPIERFRPLRRPS